MKLFTVGMFCVVALVLAACNVESRAPGKNEYDPSKIGYYRDTRTNLCYGVISYDRMASNGNGASGMAHTNVPCTDEVMKILRK